MKKKIALLPVDARPVTRQLPIELAKLADWEVLAPEQADLGFLKQAADVGHLQYWLKETAPKVDGMVLSIDMLLYGGLVPSRIHEQEKEQLNRRLELLKEIREEHPDIQLMVFSSTMRISNNNVNEEEKEYWQTYGTAIWGLSYHTHRFETTGDEADQRRADEWRASIPEDILHDYQATRQINYSMNLELLQLLEGGTIDRIVFPQDDTSEYGWNVQEQAQLSKVIREQHLSKEAVLYPGADEVASTLLTRMIFQLEEQDLPCFYPVSSGMKGYLSSAMYEDRPLMESVKGQIFAIGSRTEDDFAQADIVLGVNVPGIKQGDLALELNMNLVDTNDRNISEWLRRLETYLGRKPVALVDLAYANGADPRMIPELLETISWQDLIGFAAWNTAGNSIGTVVSQAALQWLADRKGMDVKEQKDHQILHRILEDYLYQSIVRKEGRALLGKGEKLHDVITPLFDKKASDFLSHYADGWEVSGIQYPWNRTFEIDFILNKKEEMS
ncbi:DUF4127 family protein [Halobacillus litoralis]|uniref:DUF4127 family protein n=1 Tax=Halobacillus litoralis TaxID=45668 RepID=UPI001CD1A140|nr:DUF4127 family protein [Halobacillus litoralis]MCA0970588.1 DUF4127 family protein [Halobacillus litoralis]